MFFKLTFARIKFKREFQILKQATSLKENVWVGNLSSQMMKSLECEKWLVSLEFVSLKFVSLEFVSLKFVSLELCDDEVHSKRFEHQSAADDDVASRSAAPAADSTTLGG